uniref:TIR domain-containing protein n=1 Tax=Haemonchus contortus TaxID=6289 RepID=A0A7I4YNM2_HAECO
MIDDVCLRVTDKFAAEDGFRLFRVIDTSRQPPDQCGGRINKIIGRPLEKFEKLGNESAERASKCSIEHFDTPGVIVTMMCHRLEKSTAEHGSKSAAPKISFMCGQTDRQTNRT